LYFWDFTMIILLPAILLAFYAQTKVSTTFEKYLRVPAKSGMTGAEVAREILRQSGIYDVSVEVHSGRLSDYYDPRHKVLKLSYDVYNGRSWRHWELPPTSAAMPYSTMWGTRLWPLEMLSCRQPA